MIFLGSSDDIAKDVEEHMKDLGIEIVRAPSVAELSYILAKRDSESCVILLEESLPDLPDFENKRNRPVILMVPEESLAKEPPFPISDFVILPLRGNELVWRYTWITSQTMGGRMQLQKPLQGHEEFSKTLDREWRRSLRYSWPLSIILCRLHWDPKKNTIAASNHLREVIYRLFQESIHRPGDYVVARGNHEFGLILTQTDLPGAKFVWERLRTQLSSVLIDSAPVPFNMGAASVNPLEAYNGSPATSENPCIQLEQRAMAALQKATEVGPNRVLVWE